MIRYGLFGKFVAVAGSRDQLVEILIKAAGLLEANPDCLHYLVGTADKPDEVWVFEAWTSREAHDKALEPDNIRRLVAAARPLIAEMPPGTELSIVGGKGVS